MTDGISVRGGLLTGRPVCVVGGGVGGLTAALAMAQRGAEVELREQAEAFTEVGAGIQISPNGLRVLAALGVSLEDLSVRAEAVEPMDGLTGRPITRFDLGAREYRFVHRAALIDALVSTCRGAGVGLVTGARVEARPEAEIVVAADGLHSAFRAALNPAEEAFFTGQVAWRTVVEDVEAEPVARVWMAPGKHIVTYPLPGRRLNVVAVQERAEWRAEGWHHEADLVAFRACFQEFSGRVTGWLDRAERVMEWGLFRREVAGVWQDDQGLALVGDAAHPTLPFLAQGANLALEDAYVLAACVDEGPDGLARYQVARRERVVRAIGEANANARRYHAGGLMRPASHLVLRAHWENEILV